MIRNILFVLTAAIAAILGYSVYSWQAQTVAGEPYGSDFRLVAANSGEPVTEANFRDGPTAVFFGFTHCPEICPTTLYELNGWLGEIGSDGDRIDAYFVTVDPQRDTQEVLGRYVGNVSQRITPVTGDPQAVEEMLSGYHIYFRRVDQENGNYTMDHTASIILLDSRGEFFGTIAYGEDPEAAKAKLQRLASS